MSDLVNELELKKNNNLKTRSVDLVNHLWLTNSQTIFNTAVFILFTYINDINNFLLMYLYFGFKTLQKISTLLGLIEFLYFTKLMWRISTKNF